MHLLHFLQDSFIRLCELNIAYASKLNEFGYWVDYPHNLGIADCKISAKNDLKGEEQLIQYSRDKGAFKVLIGDINSIPLSLVSLDHLHSLAARTDDFYHRSRPTNFLGFSSHLSTGLSKHAWCAKVWCIV